MRLLSRLARLFPEPGARVMLGATGADAVTAALKTAVLATGRAGVVAFHGAYHGLSHGPLAACGLHEGFRAPFAGQLGDHVRFVPYPGEDGVDEAIYDGPDGCDKGGDELVDGVEDVAHCGYEVRHSSTPKRADFLLVSKDERV